MINQFRGSHFFLSNFYLCSITYEGIRYPSVEHAYQASKTLDHGQRQRISAVPTPGLAKREGRRVVLRPDWEQIKLGVMLEILRVKFLLNSKLGKMLAATGNRDLVEGNLWGDTFWGIYKGRGENHLGRLLMQVRGELPKATRNSALPPV